MNNFQICQDIILDGGSHKLNMYLWFIYYKFLFGSLQNIKAYRVLLSVSHQPSQWGYLGSLDSWHNPEHQCGKEGIYMGPTVTVKVEFKLCLKIAQRRDIKNWVNQLLNTPYAHQVSVWVLQRNTADNVSCLVLKSKVLVSYFSDL